MFLIIISAIPLLTVLFWWAAHRRLAQAGLAAKPARIALAVFLIYQIVFVAAVFAERRFNTPLPIPTIMRTFGYVWSLAVLPIVVPPLLVLWWIRARAEIATRNIQDAETLLLASVTNAPDVKPVTIPADEPVANFTLTRRELLVVAGVSLPIVATAVGTGKAFSESAHFAVTKLELVYPDLPLALEGFKIAHVSDVHVGYFTRGGVLDHIRDSVNAMQPDLIAVTGDIIDYDQAKLPEALAMLKGMKARYGLFICEGNHDLFGGRPSFEKEVRASGLPLLINQSERISVAGQVVEIMGIRWGSLRGGRGADLEANMKQLMKNRPASAPDFSILLAHHPHAFDIAIDHGIPLTLAGHTHGGQLMLTKRFGAGTMLFKYVSGEYSQGSARLVVSNGTGNWFPLRIGAPAEIGEITLRRA